MEAPAIQYQCLKHLLRPIVRYCLRWTLSYQELVRAAKEVFVEVAEEEIRKASHKVNVSRISALTGIMRKDVTKIFRDKEPVREGPLSYQARVIALWCDDSRFCSTRGRPKVLSFRGERNEFSTLVSQVSQHLNPGTLLFELERSGAVERVEGGLKLKHNLLHLHADPRKGFALLSQDIDLLINCVEENVHDSDAISNLHIRTEYDNVSKKSLPKIRRWLVAAGKQFHRRARTFIAKHDLDVSSAKTKREEGGARVVVSAFSFTSRIEP